MTSSDNFDISFKFFSPLRPSKPSLSSEKKKKKKSSKKLDTEEDLIKRKTKKEKRVTKDILTIACGISDRLASREAFDSDDVSVDLDINPDRLKLLNARLSGGNNFIDNKQVSLSLCNNTLSNNEENMSKKRKSQEVSKSTSPKKKHKSDKDRKRKLSQTETNEDSSENSDNQGNAKHSNSDTNNFENNHSNDESEEQSNSENNHLNDGSDDQSGSENSEPDSDDLDRSEINRSHSNEESIKKTPKKIRCNIQQGFDEATKEKRRQCINMEELTDKELWLIQAPSDLNIEHLKDKNVGFGQISSIKIQDNEVLEVTSSAVTSELKLFTPVLPARTELNNYNTGCKFSGQICINRSMKVPRVPPILVQPRPVLEIPNDLKLRYIPFGADSPDKVKKGKKSKKSEKQADDSRKKHKKKKKKKSKE